jgi:hypothetical protein
MKSQVVAVIFLFSLLGSGHTASGSQHNAGEYFRPREQLGYFEIYHIETNVLYRSGITLDRLIEGKPVDVYVRIRSNDTRAVSDLYQALNGTTINLTEGCSPNSPDMRWGIVLNYRDGTRDAIGFPASSSCAQILSKTEPVVASAALRIYVEHNFPFMH